ncbi:hypothetical protein [Actinacidiphila sp. bgisy144]|uniref:hypothetical protein n=1 Tax=Actinacidiphila sp. bgisy144 TaxID=3413791 RepID=UPI003EBB3D4C
MPWADNSTIWARLQVTTDPVPPTDDPQQPLPFVFVVIDLAAPDTLSHTSSMTHNEPPGSPSGRLVTTG